MNIIGTWGLACPGRCVLREFPHTYQSLHGWLYPAPLLRPSSGPRACHRSRPACVLTTGQQVSLKGTCTEHQSSRSYMTINKTWKLYLEFRFPSAFSLVVFVLPTCPHENCCILRNVFKVQPKELRISNPNFSVRLISQKALDSGPLIFDWAIRKQLRPTCGAMEIFRSRKKCENLVPRETIFVICMTVIENTDAMLLVYSTWYEIF